LKVSFTVPALETVSDVLVAATVSTGTVADVEAAKLPSPPYCALNETSPLGEDDSVMLALPLFSVPVPSSVCPA
jgi:hypothetical protein